jgi:hypothetical protein
MSNDARTLSPELVEHGRTWLFEIGYSHTDEMTPRQIENLLRREWDGGLPDFISVHKDCDPC